LHAAQHAESSQQVYEPRSEDLTGTKKLLFFRFDDADVVNVVAIVPRVRGGDTQIDAGAGWVSNFYAVTPGRGFHQLGVHSIRKRALPFIENDVFTRPIAQAGTRIGCRQVTQE
jgi:hypothetical protein